MIKFRALRADEVEARISQVAKDSSYIVLLLYKDARCDMRILDEVIGPEKWQREHYECKGNLFCRVGVKCGEEWVYKSDCGTESNAEKEKGEASDSFKRACFNWGIGRELYTAPFIKIPQTGKDGNPNYMVDQNGRPKGNFAVTDMGVENGKIVSLSIENTWLHRTVFTLFPQRVCCVCGKVIPEEIYQGSMKANGKPYCSGTCKRRDTPDAET